MCVVLTHLISAIKHSDRKKDHVRPHACMQLLCLTVCLTVDIKLSRRVAIYFSTEHNKSLHCQLLNLKDAVTHSFIDLSIQLPHILHSLHGMFENLTLIVASYCYSF